jgi:hypothetical protein
MVILAPAPTLAQVNIDQDKSPAQLYAGDCAACHKSVRGLANGRSASSLAGFLGEHYTASSREAAAIAAYVMASGGGAASPAPSRAKPEGERTRANAEQQPRNREAQRPVQPEGKPPGNAAARRPEPERRAAVEPGQPGSARGPLPERHERGATRTRGRAKPLEAVGPPLAAPPPAPAPEAEAKTAVAVPVPEASPAGTAEPKVAAPAQSGDGAPVPRDNIPD